MRLISCHIEGFGVLSGKDFDFTPGLNVILAENGSGKSTLAAFIRAMLYGLEGRGGDELKSERKRYEPWQGGVYGGSLKLEAGGKTYVLRRTFGSTAKKDSFSLLDAETNLESRDFSENIGQELFGLDPISFQRTAFISQNDCETSATAGMTAKLGGLAELSGDMDRYDRAQETIKDLLNKLTPDRKTGSIKRLREEISELEREVRGADALDGGLKDAQAELERVESSLNGLRQSQAELRTKQDRAMELNSLLELREKYDLLSAERKSRREAAAAASALFASAPPEEAELDAAEERLRSVGELKLRLAGLRLSDGEAEELAALEGRSVPDAAEIERKIALCGELARLRSADGGSQAKAATRGKPLTPLIIVGALFIAAGIAAGIAVSPVWLFLAAAGIIAVAAGFALKGAPSHAEAGEGAARAKVIEDELNGFASANGISRDPNETLDALYRLRAQAERRDQLRGKLDSFKAEDPSREIEAGEAQINAFLEKYLPDPCRDAYDGLKMLRDRLGRLAYAAAELDAAETKIAAFEARRDFPQIMAADPAGRADVDSLVARLREIDSQINSLTSEQNRRNRELDGLREARDRLDEKAEELAEKRLKLSGDERRYRLLSEAGASLRQAKEGLAARYMRPLKEGFDKYYSMISGSGAEFYEIDANMSLGVYESGRLRDTRLLSRGLRDLTGLCHRMAMIDAMYRDEKPFVILDDPFTNLDGARTEGGLKFLAEAAKEYQIIYFTCHGSRA